MDEPTRPRRWARGFALPFALLPLTLGLVACGGGSGDDVATLGGDTGDESTQGDGTTREVTEEDRQQAMLDFAKCMREHGVDMPDPTFDDEGGGSLVIGGPDGGPTDPAKVDAAREACDPLMKDVVDGAARDMDPEEVAEMQQRALDFAKCMRDHGIDMPDPQFESGGGMTQSMTADPNDPTFQAAQEECAGENGGPGLTFGTGKANGGDE